MGLLAGEHEAQVAGVLAREVVDPQPGVDGPITGARTSPSPAR